MTKFADKISFLIDHIDPLGQGVFKKDDKIYFIPKTLPNESGSAIVLKRKKGVHFAKLDMLKDKSPQRIQAKCIHYDQCQGCHYLHCSYADEISFKMSHFKRLLTGLDYHEKPEVLKADERFYYRNRIQLHYHKKAKAIGFHSQENKIISVQDCLIAHPKIKKVIKDLYQDENWLRLCQDQPIKGHVEIYLKDNDIQVQWNKKYAHGGFTQVNQAMNNKLIKLIEKNSETKDKNTILDLFGGNGNLSENLPGEKYILDFYTISQNKENFYHLDLFEKKSLEVFTKKSKLTDADIFLIDPPRRGFNLIDQWTEKFRPQKIIYVSCHPQTMMRDLKGLKGYKITQSYLIDLFPSTFHYEACVFLEQKPN